MVKRRAILSLDQTADGEELGVADLSYGDPIEWERNDGYSVSNR